MNPEYLQQENEDFLSWKLRLIVGKIDKEIDLDWVEIRDLLGLECNPDHLRKTAYGIYEYREYVQQKVCESSSSEIVQDIQNKTIEYQKSKYQLQDQKREYTNLIKNQARFEHLRDEVNKAILEVSKVKPLNFNHTYNNNANKTAIALFSDWHFGADFSNSLNSFNEKVFRQRVEKLISKIIEYGKRNEVSTLTLGIIGDMISGIIHVSTRVQSSENVIRQTQIVSEVLAQSIATLANEFNAIKIVNIVGNHSRAIASKNDSLLKENFEYLIPWYLESRLSGFSNVEIHTDTDGYFIDEVCGNKIVFVHGDLDSVSNTANVIPQLLGFVPKYIFAGHIHHNHVKEHGRTTVITNGSLMGVDDYSMSKRYYAEPMQKFMIMNEDGIECCYDIKLN